MKTLEELKQEMDAAWGAWEAAWAAWTSEVARAAYYKKLEVVENEIRLP